MSPVNKEEALSKLLSSGTACMVTAPGPVFSHSVAPSFLRFLLVIVFSLIFLSSCLTTHAYVLLLFLDCYVY